MMHRGASKGVKGVHSLSSSSALMPAFKVMKIRLPSKTWASLIALRQRSANSFTLAVGSSSSSKWKPDIMDAAQQTFRPLSVWSVERSTWMTTVSSPGQAMAHSTASRKLGLFLYGVSIPLRIRVARKQVSLSFDRPGPTKCQAFQCFERAFSTTSASSLSPPRANLRASPFSFTASSTSSRSARRSGLANSSAFPSPFTAIRTTSRSLCSSAEAYWRETGQYSTAMSTSSLSSAQFCPT
mmetsp:Transcript_73955/g.154138  ORF Transcript_73955/g.154138 Transcript_73955/m.154138 type:complete len:240 (+) Transcript_73955:312-1031(+)